ncbi:MAG: hypothetical protein NDI91_11075 [Sulfuritalea sp.]|nr:hypothetical protein [Sulfuritalea sp.]
MPDREPSLDGCQTIIFRPATVAIPAIARNIKNPDWRHGILSNDQGSIFAPGAASPPAADLRMSFLLQVRKLPHRLFYMGSIAPQAVGRPAHIAPPHRAWPVACNTSLAPGIRPGPNNPKFKKITEGDIQ